ncbi:MAG TPA: glycosyltransferase family 4 protein [Elusimicrobiota bacterium]|nr:glycosyltransferase family 4 protein [Elusimicrobiota bacterium]
MPRKIKVAHIVTLLEFGGAQQNTLYTVEHLDRNRFEPLLLCGRGAYLDGDAEKSGYPTIFINSLDRPLRPLRDMLAFLEIFFVLKREKPDIVHTHSSKAGVLGRWAAKCAGVPFIVHTFHGFGFTSRQNIWLRWTFILIEKISAYAAHVLLAVSQANREEALRHGIGRPDKYRLLRSGIARPLFQSLSRRPNAPEGLPLTPDLRLVTTIGPFKPQKNLSDFVAMAGRVHAKHPEARFLIVGDGELRPLLEQEIERHGLTAVFYLPGWRRDIPHIMMRSNIFVLTSLWEGLPRALVEAMCAALPCVANAVDGVNDIVNDGANGFLVPPRRPDLTAERVNHLLENPNFASEMGHRARQSIGDEFDIDEMVRRQEELYSAAVHP